MKASQRNPAKSVPVAGTPGQPDPGLRTLLLKAIALEEEGVRQPGHPELTSDKKYNTQHLLKIARSASLPEIRVLLRASEIRENGLALLKAGEIAAGAESLREAQRVVSEATLGREARLSANSFQYPAEAFLQYKRGEYHQAEASLVQAIMLCHTLRDDYQHQVEVRRVHLARNVVRVKTRAGNREDALVMASLLVEYLEGHQAQWPLGELRMASTPDPLRPEERWALLDQVLGEIALLTTRDAISGDFLDRTAGWLFTNDVRAANEFAQVHAWLAARRAMIEGDVRGFLTNSVRFFAGGRGYLSHAWRELASDLLDLCNEITPEDPVGMRRMKEMIR